MSEQVFTKVYNSIFTSGVARELGDARFRTLLALASFMNVNGVCFPSQDKLAEILGVERTTMNRRMKALLDFRWNDKPIVKIVHFNGRFNTYKIEPIAQIAKFDGDVVSIPAQQTLENRDSSRDENSTQIRSTNKNQELEKPSDASEDQTSETVELLTPKSVIGYFCKKYRDAYSVNASVNWGRDMKSVKTLMNDFNSAQIVKIMDVVFDEYEDRWASREFPRPTLGAICTWLGNKALAVADQIDKEQALIEDAQNGERFSGGQSVDDIIAKLKGVG